MIGFPQGNSTTAVKVYETEQACKDGAQEIDMVVNIGKVLGEDWDYVEKEIAAIVSTFERYEYDVIYYFGDEKFENEVHSNYRHLMNYLDI